MKMQMPPRYNSASYFVIALSTKKTNPSRIIFACLIKNLNMLICTSHLFTYRLHVTYTLLLKASKKIKTSSIPPLGNIFQLHPSTHLKLSNFRVITFDSAFQSIHKSFYNLRCDLLVNLTFLSWKNWISLVHQRRTYLQPSKNIIILKSCFCCPKYPIYNSFLYLQGQIIT